METLKFRPLFAVRAAAALIGILCLVASCHQFWIALTQREIARVPVALLLLMPAVVGVTVFRRRIHLDDSGILTQTIGVSQRVPYSAVRRVDEMRSGLIIETAEGPIGSTWLNRSEREKLLRAVVERARLIRILEDPPYGILARYVPRAKEISFIPHHARKQTKSADSGDVVS